LAAHHTEEKMAKQRTAAQKKAAHLAAVRAWATMKSKAYLRAANKGRKAIEAYLSSR